MRALVGITGALLLSACAYAPPTQPIGASASSGFVVAPPAWRPVSVETGKIKDAERLALLEQAFPDSSSVHLRNLQAHFAANDTAAIIKEAVWLAERGYLFSEASREQLLKLAGDTAVAAKLAQLFAHNSRPVTASSLAATVPADAQLVEGIAIDPRNGRMLVSTVISRSLFNQTADGQWEAGELPGVDSLSGISFDPSGDALWVASADLGMNDAAERPAFQGLIRVPADQRGNRAAYRTLEGGAPSDIHVAADGKVYASDPVNGAIYVTNDTQTSLTRFADIWLMTFRSPQGLTTSEDGSKLYISDYRYGIAVFDLGTRKLTRLTAQKPMILDGIDGMWRHGNRLIGIQNGTSPMRIVAIDLSIDGLSATNLTVLEQAHPGWTEPLGGTIHNGSLYYVATGQWDRFDKDGEPKADKPPIATEIRRLPL